MLNWVVEQYLGQVSAARRQDHLVGRYRATVASQGAVDQRLSVQHLLQGPTVQAGLVLATAHAATAATTIAASGGVGGGCGVAATTSTTTTAACRVTG